MEHVLTIDPFCSDDRRILNGLYKQGYNTVGQIVEEREDGSPLLFFHLKKCFCYQCKVNRGEIEPESWEDDGEHWDVNGNH